MAVTYQHTTAPGSSRLQLKNRIIKAGILTAWTVFPGILKKFIKQQFFTPRRVRLTPSQHQYLETGEPFEITVNDEVLKCRRWGEGPALVFVHGWNGVGLQFRHFTEQALARGFSVVLFDGPGHGLSGGTFCSYFQMTDAVRAMVNQPFPDRVAGLVGHSFGAAAIVNGLEKEGSDLPAVLIAPALDLVGLLNAAFALHAVPDRVYKGIIGEFEARYGYTFAHDNPLDLMAGLTQPLLVIHDTSDRVIPHSVSELPARQLDRVRLMSTHGLGHKRLLKDTLVIQESIRHFEL